MEIVGGSATDHPLGATAFLSCRPDEEDHEIALFANPAFAHTSDEEVRFASPPRKGRETILHPGSTAFLSFSTPHPLYCRKPG